MTGTRATSAGRPRRSTTGDVLMGAHGMAVFVVCIVLTKPMDKNAMTATDPLVYKMAFAGIFVYALHSMMLVAERQVFTSMFYHHVWAIILQSLMCYYNLGLACYQYFAWTELGTIFHKLVPKMIPNYHNQPWKRAYQLFYLSCYLVTYLFVVYWVIADLHGDYPLKRLWGCKTSTLHSFGKPLFVLLLVYWLYEVLQGVIFVLGELFGQMRQITRRHHD